MSFTDAINQAQNSTPSVAPDAPAEPIIAADDLEAQLEAVFTAMGGVKPDDDPAADSPADPVAPYVDAPLPPVDPAATAPVDDDGIPDATPEQIAAEALADPDASATPPDPTANLIDLGGGVVVDRAEAAGIINWVQSLSPAEVAAVERALANQPAASGSGTLAPGYTAQGPGVSPQPTYAPPQPPYTQPVGQPGAPVYPGAIPQPYPQPQPVAPYQPIPQQGYPQPIAPATPQPFAPQTFDPAAVVGPLAELAPELGNFLAAQAQQTAMLQAEIARNTAFQQEQLVAQAREREAQQNAAIQAGRDQFAQDHPDFTDVDLHYLANRAASMNSIVGLLREHNGDMRAAMNDALTTAMWSDPAYRDRVQQAAIQTHAETSADIAARREAAASLSGSRGAIGQVQQPAPQTLPPDQRRAALASDVAAAIAGQ